VRVFEVNGVPFDFRAGGWSENLFLHYSAADLASQITLIKSMGINGNEDLHVLYADDTGSVTIDNLSGAAQPGLSVQARVYDTGGKVLDSQTASGLALAAQGVQNAVLTPKVPAATTPPTPAKTYFVELILRQHGVVVDRNVYWLSTQADVIDWDSTEGNPQANNGSPLSQYADMSALQHLPSEPVQVAAATRPASGGRLTTSVTITNPSSNSAVAFFLRADGRRGTLTAPRLVVTTRCCPSPGPTPEAPGPAGRPASAEHQHGVGR
jgi:hypothetical protein